MVEPAEALKIGAHARLQAVLYGGQLPRGNWQTWRETDLCRWSLESSKRKVGFPYLSLCCMDRKEWFERSKRQLKFSEATENLTEVNIRIKGTRTNVGSSRNDQILKRGSDTSPQCFKFCIIKSLFIY